MLEQLSKTYKRGEARRSPEDAHRRSIGMPAVMPSQAQGNFSKFPYKETNNGGKKRSTNSETDKSTTPSTPAIPATPGTPKRQLRSTASETSRPKRRCKSRYKNQDASPADEGQVSLLEQPKIQLNLLPNPQTALEIEHCKLLAYLNHIEAELNQQRMAQARLLNQLDSAHYALFQSQGLNNRFVGEIMQHRESNFKLHSELQATQAELASTRRALASASASASASATEGLVPMESLFGSGYHIRNSGGLLLSSPFPSPHQSPQKPPPTPRAQLRDSSNSNNKKPA
jgi:hypothetical protein